MYEREYLILPTQYRKDKMIHKICKLIYQTHLIDISHFRNQISRTQYKTK